MIKANRLAVATGGLGLFVILSISSCGPSEPVDESAPKIKIIRVVTDVKKGTVIPMHLLEMAEVRASRVPADAIHTFMGAANRLANRDLSMGMTVRVEDVGPWNLPCAAKNIPANAVITKDDVSMGSGEERAIPDDALLSDAVAVGRTTRIPIKIGKIIDERDLKQTVAIAKVDMQANHVIEGTDLETRVALPAETTEDFIHSPADAVSKTTKNSIERGKPLTKADLAENE